jgi:small subunit ribosomal protein S13
MADVKYIIRVQNTDLDGRKPLYVALTKIKGIGVMYANMVCNLSKLDRNMLAGSLNQDQVKLLDDIIENPDKYDIPEWMLNKRKDIFDGKSKHLTGGKLKFSLDTDIRLMMKTKSNRGLRHAWGLPVRGQRTKSNFRRNKGKAVGVSKRKDAKGGRV